MVVEVEVVVGAVEARFELAEPPVRQREVKKTGQQREN
jgi:hypothetical protein